MIQENLYVSIVHRAYNLRKKWTTCSKPNTRFAHSISLVINKFDLARRGAIFACNESSKHSIIL